MHFYGFESTLDKRKSVFNAFRRKPSLGALPEAYISVTSASSLPCLVVRWGSLNMDISPIVVVVVVVVVFLSYPTACDRIVVLSMK